MINGVATSTERREDIVEEEEGERERQTKPIIKNHSTPTTPLPWKQLIVISMMRLSEPINFTVIFPFINDFLWDLNTTKGDKTKLGLYAGIIESLFAVCQTLTILQWARASDKYGRRPILINGLIGSSLSSILIGTSSCFPVLIFARMLSGALNGNVAVYKAIIGEICDKTNSARAFSILSLTWSLGCIIGPLLGGYLSKPSEKYKLFSTKYNGFLAFGGFWETFPYLLPCLCAACFSCLSIFLATFILKETLPSKVGTNGGEVQDENQTVDENSSLLRSSGRTYNSVTNTPPSNNNKEITIWEILKIQQIRRQLMSSSILALTMISIDAVNILYFWTPIQIGGLSFPSKITGQFFSLSGIWGVILLIGIFPFLQKRFGTLTLYRFCISGLILIPLIMPLGNFIAKNGLRNPSRGGYNQGEFEIDVNKQSQKIIFFIIALGLILKTSCAMAYSCNSIMINQAAAFGNGIPLATLNALAQMSFSCMNAFGPYTFSTLYAITLENHLLGGHLIWFILITFAILGSLFSLGLFDIEKMVERGEISEEAANRRT